MRITFRVHVCTECMYAVYDEHGSHSFKSDGWPARRPRMQEVISDQEKEYRQNSEAINMRMHGVFLHTHRVGTVHTARLALSDHSCQMSRYTTRKRPLKSHRLSETPIEWRNTSDTFTPRGLGYNCA